MTSRAAIIAVGSELLSGQILNRNAAWLSGKLFDIGFDTAAHLTVDDVEPEIVRAIDTAARDADLLFLTGGLGPTSDDLTRNAVAAWSKQELVYDDGSWKHLEGLFGRLGVKPPEANRQQCYFPRGAKVLTNAAGTANAFALEARGKRLWILPGPPKEVETIWNDHVAAAVTALVSPDQRKTLRMWRTVGRGESHLGEAVEALIKGRGVEVAYRAHAPYVETKLRFPAARAAELQDLCDALDVALGQWLFEKDREDGMAALARRIGGAGVVDVYDGVSQGHLVEMLAPSLREHAPGATGLSFVTAYEQHESPAAFIEEALGLATDAELHLVVAGFADDGTWAAGVRSGESTKVIERPSPYKGEAGRTRNPRAVGALAAKAWLDLLSEDLQ